MRAIFVLFDSLNRLALGCYGGTLATPNFDRFAGRAVSFDTHYVGSLPCMPARRDIHTGRLNFPHRSWGPLEPFDNSFAEILKHNGVHTHLVTDHAHYFEEGGATYHTRYSTWDFIRGQENDPWKAMVKPPLERFREKYDQRHYPFGAEIDASSRMRAQHAINKEFMREEADYPGPRCFASGLEFLETNRHADNWFLQIECFDPHEPFDAPERFRAAYETGWQGGVLNWPYYEHVTGGAEEIAEIRANYAALVAMCDDYFGRLLDFLDAGDMWKDTALILTTDHGYLLSEHDWWSKNLQPYYEEISHIPLIVHHPEFASLSGSRIAALTQTYDLMPTVLDIFGAPIPIEVQGRSVLAQCRGGQHVRPVGIFGMFGGPIGATDGRYAYRRPLCARPARIHADAGAYPLDDVVSRIADGRTGPRFQLHQGHAAVADRCTHRGAAHPQCRRARVRKSGHATVRSARRSSADVAARRSGNRAAVASGNC